MYKQIDIKVKSCMYGITTCVIDIDQFKNGFRCFPCGDGCDYDLKQAQIRQIKRDIKQMEVKK